MGLGLPISWVERVSMRCWCKRRGGEERHNEVCFGRHNVVETERVGALTCMLRRTTGVMRELRVKWRFGEVDNRTLYCLGGG